MRAKFGTADWQTRKDCEKHCVVGFKLDCTRLCNDLICKELGVFNRLYWAHCLTGKNMLQLSETERKTVVALDIKQNPTAMLKDTAHWVRHCQLSWDRTGNKPNWVNQENTASWFTGLIEDTDSSPASTAKMMPNWLSRGITAMKEAVLGRSTEDMD
jgi:hypothetical protein